VDAAEQLRHTAHHRKIEPVDFWKQRLPPVFDLDLV